MGLAEFTLVGLGGFLGAILRLIITERINRGHTFLIPVATLTINLIGSFILGFITGFSINHVLMLLMGTGVLGAFTTFSTFILESNQLYEKKKRRECAMYIIFSLCGGILFAYIGVLIGKML